MDLKNTQDKFRLNIEYIKNDKEIQSLEAHKWYFEGNVMKEGFELTPTETVMHDIIKILDKCIQQQKDKRDELWRIISPDTDKQSSFS